MTNVLSSARISMVAWCLIATALLIGFVTRIAFLYHYVDFDYDQVRDAFLYAAMRNGYLTTLGPPISGDFFYLLPLYYYIVVPFTFFGYDPTLQALPNALLSFLTIPLLIVGLYRLLDGLPHALRLFWGALGGLWWSLMVTDIILATRDWNPSSAPFFMLAFVLLAGAQIRTPAFNRTAVLSWIALGACLAMLMSVHATTLYVMPVVFVAAAGAFIVRSSSRLRASALVFIALASMIACLTPYWYGEIQNHWHNSQAIMQYTLHHAAGEYPATTTTTAEKIVRSLRAYLWLGGEGYFAGANGLVRFGGELFLIGIIPSAFMTFRGDRRLFYLFACLWAVFLFTAAFHQSEEVRYRLPIVMMPLFLTIAALAFMKYDTMRGRVSGNLLAIGMAASILANARMDVLHATYVFGSSRLVAVSDVISALKSIPEGASLCYSTQSDSLIYAGRAFEYIDAYVTHRHLRLSDRCMPGSYAVVPKFVAMYGAGYGMGSDFYVDRSNYTFSYLTYVGHRPGPPAPDGSRVVEQNEAFTLIRL
jgi:hypothetical protein